MFTNYFFLARDLNPIANAEVNLCLKINLTAGAVGP